jgi:predicted alpha-1,6-mannanase (GH76 family)
VCNIFCDGRDSSLALSPRVKVEAEIFGRVIQLVVSDLVNVAFANISNGNPGDEVWLDRSFDGGLSWSDDSKIGYVTIPGGLRTVSTPMFNVDDPKNNFRIGALRACGKAGDREEIVCTGWARSSVLAESRIEAAATALMQFYNDQGLWTSTGWWNAANCLTAIIDYIRLTGSTVYSYAIETTFEKNKNNNETEGNFTNMYIDDTGWWGLAWVDAFDLTQDRKYLDMAEIDSDFMYRTRDDHCGGGIWWSTDKDYKNAIPNELFIKLAASLHNRIPGDTKYLSQAIDVFTWFENSGMYNSDDLINDGLTDDCQNNGRETWTYNQGVILGGLVQLQIATGDNLYLDKARKIADAVLRSSHLNPEGILREPCEIGGGECGPDATSFKGIFIRNLGELNRALPDRPYTTYLRNLADVIYERDRNSLDQYGVHYAGPFTISNAANQHGALEVFTAAI